MSGDEPWAKRAHLTHSRSPLGAIFKQPSVSHFAKSTISALCFHALVGLSVGVCELPMVWIIERPFACDHSFSANKSAEKETGSNSDEE